MMISTKGRYALRVMIDLAQNSNEGYVSLTSISKRQEISLKYLEAIIAMLNRAGYVKSLRGVNGGYKLTREPSDYSVGEILRLTEGGFTLVACLNCNNLEKCNRSNDCLTLPLWTQLDNFINGYLDSITLIDIINQDYKKDYQLEF